ncbi:protoporphyrinogen oxidase HemJ [Aestuariivirga litoralis]|uniref:protoporphyrinogen oxidase HemJ n=1 Tax=Aestuariivirga litoralis TaxID=2650924 RepID=UPI0018C5F95D|nr:protoporphyrinogen oxidase HemJ [Aestuariivirga litoralis]MBG1233773.1 protoporphyrinogen oxidase HemJ [Aestuariivirga litoralis]
MLYLWLKVIHIVAVIAWMAALFYMPRLFVYHTDAKSGSEMDETFKVMERRLMKAIMRPAALVALIAGAATVHLAGFAWSSPWLSFKLLGVFGVFAYHGVLERYVASFARGERLKPQRFFRILNEVPTVLLIWIVIFVVVKPFS